MVQYSRQRTHFPINRWCFPSIILSEAISNKLRFTPMEDRYDQMYGYRSYLESTLSFSKAAKSDQLQIGGYYKDTANPDLQGNTVKTGTNANKGANARFKWTKGSKTVERLGQIHNELFAQKKLILSQVKLTVRLVRQYPSFVLMAKDHTHEYTISLEEAILKINIETIAEHVRLSHEERLLQGPAKYPVTSVQMKFYTRGANRSDLSENNLSQGRLPGRIVVGLVESDAFNGTLDNNPFNFQHFNVSSITLRQNRTPVPFETIKLDYGNDQFLPGYFTELTFGELTRE
ncbi:uncharacterized protein F54H12.2-like [Lineus longissimus]|uniref:uncharacterized protein F54H12.2-like n=1 Tax=Lineus longissimus TaxID=88925 RepID=UPI00315D44E8